MKPRIYKWHGSWYCRVGETQGTPIGIGATPVAAYQAWELNTRMYWRAYVPTGAFVGMDFAKGKDQSAKITWMADEVVGWNPSIVITDEPWRDQLFQEWQPSEKDIKLSELAAEYHERCEAYDRTVCTGPNGRGGIVPASYKEFGLIIKNANHVYATLLRKATEHGITKQELRRAIGKDR